MRTAIHLGTLALLLCAGEATIAADAGNGARLAQRKCASCHIVSGSRERSKDGTPSLAFIARRVNYDVNAIVIYLLDPHMVMPNVRVTRAEAEDIAAYMTQRPR